MRDAKYFDGPPCRRCETTQRYVASAKCVRCSRTSKDVDDIPARPVVIVVKQPGCCQHGVGLRAFCRQCETAWRGRPRFEPKIYDLVSYEDEAVPLNFDTLIGAAGEPARSHKGRGANATASRRAPGRPRLHAAAT